MGCIRDGMGIVHETSWVLLKCDVFGEDFEHDTFEKREIGALKVLYSYCIMPYFVSSLKI